MRFSNAYSSDNFGLSFEVFPPKTPQGETALYRHIGELAELKPKLITCTYGAGGSTREKTLDIVSQVRKQFGLPVASHLTCVGSTVEQLRHYLAEARQRGIENIVALRGDPPRGETSFQAVKGGLRFANELVDLIKTEFPNFGIAVAGYPEKHQEAPSLEVDLANLKRKVDAGADVVITQLFYNNADFFRFRDACDIAGICVPIVPGLLPVINFGQIKRITSLCGAKLPDDYVEQLQRCGDDADAQFDVGVDFATRQLDELIQDGVPGAHLYVLNKSRAARCVCQYVSIPSPSQEA